MATVTFTIPDNKVALLAEAVEHGRGFEREDQESDGAFVKRYIRTHVTEVHFGYRRKKAAGEILVDDDLITETT